MHYDDRFQRLMDAVQNAGIRAVVLHGHDDIEKLLRSDIDCIVSSEDIPTALGAALVHSDFNLVQYRHHGGGHQYILADRSISGSYRFLIIDASEKFCSNWTVFYPRNEIVKRSMMAAGYSIPQTKIELTTYLIKKLGLGTLTAEHHAYLSHLFNMDPTGGLSELSRFWCGNGLSTINNALQSGRWEDVYLNASSLRREMWRRAFLNHPFSSWTYRLSEIPRRIKRLMTPNGIWIVFLGPDGCGKTTVLERTRTDLSAAFRRTAVFHFSPRLLRRTASAGPVTDPHSTPERSFVGSFLKLLYWLVDFSVGHQALVRPRLVRSAFVLFDRHLIDVLVDRKRYRYGGPAWPVRAISKIVPTPDLVILLDAPPEVIHERKKEVPIEETARQRNAYRLLISSLPNGHVVDASQALDEVVASVNQVILDYLAARTRRRLGLQS